MQRLSGRYFCLSTLLFLLLTTTAQAESLKSILKFSLIHDPVLLEARADEESAYNRVEQAKSLRWPTVRVTGNSGLIERHKNSSNRMDAFEPGVEVSMNVYSWGAVDAEIEKNQFNQEYFRHKYSESREELGYTVGDLYITALNAKQAVDVLKRSLKRNNEILGDLGVIVENDRGRQSEYVQAQARLILVKQQINDQQKLLDATLSTLSKYTKKYIKERDLSDPFKGMSEKLLKRRYTLKEKGQNPTYLAQKAELESKIKDVEAEKAKQKPVVNLVGSATPDDQQVRLNVSWDVFNRATEFTVKEKASLRTAAERRLERVVRDAEEAARLALIQMKRNEIQLKTLRAQKKSTAEVVEFYQLQFTIARRSLIEVLNAERELADVELATVNTKNEWNRAVLSYLRSQGKISNWAGMFAKSTKKSTPKKAKSKKKNTKKKKKSS